MDVTFSITMRWQRVIIFVFTQPGDGADAQISNCRFLKCSNETHGKILLGMANVTGLNMAVLLIPSATMHRCQDC